MYKKLISDVRKSLKTCDNRKEKKRLEKILKMDEYAKSQSGFKQWIAILYYKREIRKSVKRDYTNSKKHYKNILRETM